MIATTVAYDLVFLVHVARGGRDGDRRLHRHANLGDGCRPRRRRGNAARAVPRPRATGRARSCTSCRSRASIMSLSGDSSVSLTRPWIGVGILCYLAAAGHLEARTLPLERVVERGRRPRRRGVARARRQLVRSVDVLLGLVGVAFVAMLVQF